MKKAIIVLALCFAAVAGAAAGQENGTVPNSLSDAKVGEWASYMLPGGYVQKLTVIKREGEGPYALVTVKIDNIYDGKVVESKEVTEEAGEAFSTPSTYNDEGVTVSVRNETVKIGGKQAAAGVVAINKWLGWDNEDNEVTEWWVSSDVPVFGIVKKLYNGEVEWELFKQGYDDPEAKK